jgi:hypothetical protein
MSTPAYVTHQQTRQELDKLDALIQQMLSLPLSVPDPVSPKPPTETSPPVPQPYAPLPPTLPPAYSQPRPSVQVWRAEGPPPLAVTPNTKPMVGEVPMAVPIDGPPLAQPVYNPPPLEPRFFAPPLNPNPPVYVPPQTPIPYPFSAYQAPQGPNPAAPPPPMAESVNPAAPWSPAPPQQAAKPQEPLPVLLWPLWGFNRLFDVVFYLFGPLGGWLRRPFGRKVLGWLGILMILGAIGWGVADWYGMEWTR